MRTFKYSFVLMLSVIFVSPAIAEDAAETRDGRPDREGLRQKVLEEFDEDGNGELNEAERSNAREKMRARRGKDGDKGQRGRRRGEGPPNPDELFERFDANGDNQLSREEFQKLARSVREHRQRLHREHGPRGEGHSRRPGPPEGGPRDRSGPPKEGGRDFRPLQNPGDRPPPRADGDRRRGRPEGPGGRGPEGRRPPNPDEIFDRFDENDDDQLSREEFQKLSKAMRDRHGRGKGKKAGKGQGDRRGPAGRNLPDRPRLEELEGDDGRSSPDSEDDSV